MLCFDTFSGEMMFRLSLIAIFILPFALFSQDAKNDSTSNWKTKGNAQLLLNQVAFSNWAKGGNNTISGAAYLQYSANYKDENETWNNRFDFGFGIVENDELGTRKNEDKIDILSEYSYKATEVLSYTGKFNFQSQFIEGYDYPNDSVPVSNFLAPAYVITSVGMTWTPFEGFEFYLSPATGKTTIVTDDSLSAAGAYGVTPGEQVRFEFGANATIKYSKEVMENIQFDTRLDLFNNYTDPRKDNRDRIDVNWENSIAMKINEYFTANIFAHFLYDHDIDVPLFETIDGVKTKVGTGKRLQIKQTLGIGIGYKF